VPTLNLPLATGGLAPYTTKPPRHLPAAQPPFNRIAYAAAHVVADPLADADPWLDCSVDWERTIAFRRHLWSLGLGVAEAMDTAQRGMGMDWPKSLELIRRSLDAAQDFPGALIGSGVGTDHLEPSARVTIDDVIRAYEEQCAAVEKLGGRIVLMASRALVKAARSGDDYAKVYGRILSQVKQPVIIHWLGEMFDPALAGYWGDRDHMKAMEVAVDVIADNADKVDGVKLSVYYHPRHTYNVDRMLAAMKTSLAYYRKNFGPYQFDYARIIEFPGYRAFAQSFAGTIPYSEKLGFLADVHDPDKIDYVTYVTAHELGHQYWAHQLISADMQGGTMLVESMAQYSALMVMKHLYGEDKIRRFLKFELDNYLRSRGTETIEEQPLDRVENQQYIHYRKGAVVLYLLQDRLGEDRVNHMLAALLDKYRFKGPPYARSLDLVDGFKSLARNDAERQLVIDLLEKITIYDLKAKSATVRKLPDGRFETLLTVAADKFYADGQGKEKKTKLADTIDIGLFASRPELGAFSAKDVDFMERRPIASGEQQIRLITTRKPAFAGVDPYNKYIDRNSDDNIVAVTG